MIKPKTEKEMIFHQKFCSLLKCFRNMLSEKFVIYLLLAEVFVIILILGITRGEDLAVALGTISMALAIVYIEIIKPWLRKPNIKIEFDEEKYLHREKKEKDPCYYCHFMVVNSGLSQADDCEAVLEKICVNGKERQDFIPVNLKWSC